MTSIAKRHHWWPVCHSGLWIDGAGCITTIGLNGARRRTTPANTAVIGHYNTVTNANGERDASLETFFANEIEGPVAPVLKRLSEEKTRDLALEALFDKKTLETERRQIKKDGFAPDQRAYSAELPPNDRRNLLRYIASLLVRVPSYKDRLNARRVVSDLAAVLNISAADAGFETDAMHVEIVRQHLDYYSARFMDCNLFLCDVQAGGGGRQDEFLFGDTPVIPAALGYGKAEAMCPITPSRALFIFRGYSSPVRDGIPIFRCRSATARAFNRTIVRNAEREVFCRTPVDAAFISKNLGTRKIRIVPQVLDGFDNSANSSLLLDRQGGT